MYNVKGTSKIAAKSARRGMSQNFENLHNRNKMLDSNENEIVKGPKPVFQTSRKGTNNRKSKESISPQHEELINFIRESWSLVASEAKSQSSNNNESTKRTRTVMYYEEAPSPQLQDFKPFDLESWWGKRLYTIITSSPVDSKN